MAEAVSLRLVIAYALIAIIVIAGLAIGRVVWRRLQERKRLQRIGQRRRP